LWVNYHIQKTLPLPSPLRQLLFVTFILIFSSHQHFCVLNILLSMFLCDFSYHACYLLCPPHPTQFDNAKIWCLSRKSSPPAWRVGKWLKAETLSLYTGGVYGLMVHIWFLYTSISVFVSHCCCSAPSTADGSPFLCAVLLFQALLLLFWALWFLFTYLFVFFASVSSTMNCIFQCATF